MKSLAGWGRYPVVDSLTARPERRNEVLAALAERESDPVLAHGRSRSYGDAALIRDGKVILTERLDRILGFDAETGWIRAEAGVTIEDVLTVFVPRGFFCPVVPGTQFVSLGGALACDIHGKNHHVAGSFSDHVRRVEILTASGDVVTCDAETEPELFWATAGGLGLTGVVLAMDLKLIPISNPWVETETVRVENLKEFFEVSAARKHLPYTVSWIDCVKTGSAMGRGIFMGGTHAGPNVDAPSEVLDHLVAFASPILDARGFEPNWLLNPVTMALFNEAFFHKQARGETLGVTGYTPYFFPLDAIRNWNRLYGSRGMLQYQLVVPHDPEHRAIEDVLKRVSSSGMASFLAVIKEFGDDCHSGLSFPSPGVTLALDFPNVGDKLLTLLNELDAVVLDAGGRIYLGKDARVSQDSFRKMYPQWETWREVRDRWDPKQVFQSELGRRLGLVG